MTMTGTDFFLLKPEQPNDDSQIEALLDAAFGSDRHIKTSYRLREGQPPLPGLGLTLSRDGALCGTIRFWPVEIGQQVRALLLGPLAVHPDHHGHGGGRLLMQSGLNLAAGQGHELVFLVGDLPYYRMAGFQPVPEGKVLMPGPYDPERLLYQELAAGAFAHAGGMMRIPQKALSGSPGAR